MALRIYVNGLTAWRDGVVHAFHAQLTALGIAPATLPVHETDPVAALPPRSVALYFADGAHAPTDADLASLRRHLDRGVTVIPVLDTVQDALSKLPPLLHPLNAFALGDPPDYGALVDEILARIWMGRTLRKLFISYKRSDSQAVARELFHALTGRGYEVFLDEASIGYGVNFQRELMWWLNDADFVLLLASPNLESSRWVMDEIEFANIAHVGLLGLRWSDRDGGSAGRPAVLSSLMADQVHALAPLAGSGALDTRTLAPGDLQAIVHKVDTHRAHAIQRRLVALLPYVREALTAGQLTFAAGGRFGDFLVDRAQAGDACYLRVLPFRPTLDTVYDFGQELIAIDPPPARGVLCYMENDPTDRRFRAFQWCLEPDRTGQTPSCYRLLPFTGGDLDLAVLR